MQLPIYELVIEGINDTETAWNYTALVDKPAVQRDFLVFADKQLFNIDSEEQRIISGVLMLADTPIYRNSAEYGEHYVTFSKDTIKQLAIKLSKKGFTNNVNIMHDPSMKVEGVTMFEVFQTDASRGIQPMKGFEDVPDGSLFGSMYVEDDGVWQLVKEGKVKGFSIEGMFDYKAPEMTDEEVLQRIAAMLKVSIN